MATKIDNDIHVTLEDQKKINLFARKNGRLNELRADVEEAKKRLQNIEDASDDLELLDDEETIGYKIGEVFIDHSLTHTQELLEQDKKNVEEEITGLKESIADVESLLKNLKVQLYAKFGDNINLEE
uniref:Prefoldin subunit 4 n=1 Tax=Phallusia mammillata TaxID=59560 RepID=A0A6F9DP91_9ASCI|nr:prefoldin subunit 4-like [Phallusia mammillata]